MGGGGGGGEGGGLFGRSRLFGGHSSYKVTTWPSRATTKQRKTSNPPMLGCTTQGLW